MERFFTIMIIPEKNQSVKTFRIPSLFFRSFAFLIASGIFLLGIFTYDYWKILQEVYENKHLILENRQLKEQIQLFQMKLNGLTDDIERIHTFERKLRVITGLEENPNEMATPYRLKSLGKEGIQSSQVRDPSLLKKLQTPETIEKEPRYQELKSLYNQKIAMNLGLERDYDITKDWTELMKGSFDLAERYARIDYQFGLTRSFIAGLETDVHELDQHILDTKSMLQSTPTILPTNGWLTSPYGPRHSPYSGKLKMHEGIDVGAPYGAPIVAAADGIVTYAGKKPGFGNFVQIDHGYGIETIYAHAQSVTTRRGTIVTRGDQVAKIGSTGYSTGPHLHYEVRVNGIAVDPFYFILN